VYTRGEVVEAMLDLAEYTREQPLHRLRLLEPSFGAGDFLRPAVARLLAGFVTHGGVASRVRELASAVRAVEVHAASFAATRAALREDLRAWGARASDAAALCDEWLVCGDFLLTPLAGPFDVVVGNPPYVRQERIADELLAEYRRRYATIFDRADLYVPFFERGLQLLGADGRLAFICADRWHKNRYGGPLRGLIARDYALTHYIDMAGSDAFQAEVLAYAAVTVIRRGHHGPTRIARRPALDAASLTRLAARHVARRSGAGWYRTIDRIHGELTGTPKLLIPDIKGEPMVVYDPGDYYPHHNLYHVTSARWDLRALATVLRSSIAVLFVSAYCVKMAGGFLRFQAQVLRRIRVPRWDDVTAELREALRAAGPTDLAAIDRATFAVYGLGDGDAEVVRRVAADARVRGVGGT
jgi:hypothetical protein